MPMRVFGDFERRKDGKPTGDYPAWYYTNKQQMTDLKERVRTGERALEGGFVPPAAKDRFRAELERAKDKISKIESSVPKLDSLAKDKIFKLTKELGDEITDSMYTRSDMMKGLADGHSEAERMTTKMMPTKNENEVEFAQECGVEIVDGKITRTDKERMWKIGRNALGESSNTEILRRDSSFKDSGKKAGSMEIKTGRRRGRVPRKAVLAPVVSDE